MENKYKDVQEELESHTIYMSLQTNKKMPIEQHRQGFFFDGYCLTRTQRKDARKVLDSLESK